MLWLVTPRDEGWESGLPLAGALEISQGPCRLAWHSADWEAPCPMSMGAFAPALFQDLSGQDGVWLGMRSSSMGSPAFRRARPTAL